MSHLKDILLDVNWLIEIRKSPTMARGVRTGLYFGGVRGLGSVELFPVRSAKATDTLHQSDPYWSKYLELDEYYIIIDII